MKKIAIASLGIILAGSIAGRAMAADQSVTGNLEDSFCFVTLGAHGPDHKKCATECAKKGIPVALVEKGSDKMYIVLPVKNDSSLQQDVISHMEDEVTITGPTYEKNGINYIVAKSVK